MMIISGIWKVDFFSEAGEFKGVPLSSVPLSFFLKGFQK